MQTIPARPTTYRGIPMRSRLEVRPTVERAFLAMGQMPVIWLSEPTAVLCIAVPDPDFTWLIFSASLPRRRWVLA